MINIKKFLKDNADYEYARFNEKFISTRYQIVGVRLPTLQKFAKDIEPEYIELEAADLYHEEILLYGYAAGLIKNEDEQLEYLENILPYIDNWCTCDCIVSSLKKLTGEKSYQHFSGLLKDDRGFYVRVGIVSMMRNFMKTDHLFEILRDLRAIKNDAYYIKMAKAWFYAELCVFNNEIAKEEISKIDDKFVRNKAILKAKESFRVSAQAKEELEKLKLK